MPEPALSIAVSFARRNLRWTATATLDRVVATSLAPNLVAPLALRFPKRPIGTLEVRRRLSCRGQIPALFHRRRFRLATHGRIYASHVRGNIHRARRPVLARRNHSRQRLRLPPSLSIRNAQ